MFHVDGPGELAQILLGRRGGDHIGSFPWVRKPTTSVEVRPARIEFADGAVRVGEAIHLRATTAVETHHNVSCIVPGHDRPGTELINDGVAVHDPPFDFELRGTCAFTRTFDYSG